MCGTLDHCPSLLKWGRSYKALEHRRCLYHLCFLGDRKSFFRKLSKPEEEMHEGTKPYLFVLCFVLFFFLIFFMFSCLVFLFYISVGKSFLPKKAGHLAVSTLTAQQLEDLPG